MMEEELLFRVAFLLVCGSLLAVRAYYALRGRSANRRVSWRENWDELVKYEGRLSVVVRKAVFPLWIGSLAIFAAFPSWLSWASLSFPPWLRWFEVCSAAVCLPFLVWVQHSLGKHWSTQLRLRENHMLVTSGLYRRVRHPMYTVLFVLRLAIALATANMIILLIEGAQFAVYYARIGKEEQMMLRKFGEEYRVYMMRTGRFLPRFTLR
jgi:protein-S-isoprenylcysteine O-methyltransferase Ste14